MSTDLDFIIAGGESTRHRFSRLGQPAGLRPPPSGHASEAADQLSIVVAAVERHQGRMLAAIRTNLLREPVVPPRVQQYRLTRLTPEEFTHSAVTRWTLSPGTEIRNRPDIALRLAWTLYDFHLRERICHDFLDCEEDEVNFFRSLGYRRLRQVRHPTRRPTHLMRLDVYDWSHLARVGSPFLLLAKESV